MAHDAPHHCGLAEQIKAKTVRHRDAQESFTHLLNTATLAVDAPNPEGVRALKTTSLGVGLSHILEGEGHALTWRRCRSSMRYSSSQINFRADARGTAPPAPRP